MRERTAPSATIGSASRPSLPTCPSSRSPKGGTASSGTRSAWCGRSSAWSPSSSSSAGTAGCSASGPTDFPLHPFVELGDVHHDALVRAFADQVHLVARRNFEGDGPAIYFGHFG